MFHLNSSTNFRDRIYKVKQYPVIWLIEKLKYDCEGALFIQFDIQEKLQIMLSTMYIGGMIGDKYIDFNNIDEDKWGSMWFEWVPFCG